MTYHVSRQACSASTVYLLHDPSGFELGLATCPRSLLNRHSTGASSICSRFLISMNFSNSFEVCLRRVSLSLLPGLFFLEMIHSTGAEEMVTCHIRLRSFLRWPLWGPGLLRGGLPWSVMMPTHIRRVIKWRSRICDGNYAHRLWHVNLTQDNHKFLVKENTWLTQMDLGGADLNELMCLPSALLTWLT